MSTAFQRPLARLERQRADLLDRLGGMSEAQHAFQPGPESWSIAGVVQHLLLVEEAMVRNGRRQAETRPAWVSVRSLLLGRMVVTALGTDIRVRAPNPSLLPSSQVPLAELARRWAAGRADLRAYVEELRAPRGWRTAFFHPRTGWMGAAGGIRFLEAHCTHHARQIERIMRTDGFPGDGYRGSAGSPAGARATE
jgi:hypothetical protein